MRFLHLAPLLLVPFAVACSGSSTETPGTTAGDSSTTTDTATTVDTATSVDSGGSTETSTTTDTSPTTDTSATDTATGSDTATTVDTGPKPDTAGGFCGGIAGVLCDKGSYCAYTVGSCGKGDMGGTCAPIPSGCTKELNPVCGCDGKDYGNPCLAAMGGTSIAKMGACGTVPGGSCGGKPGGVCAKTEYCDYPDGAMCGAFDSTGTCTKRPEGCIEIFDPVCGCDGKTYSNSCIAAAAGFDFSAKGDCPKK